MEKDGMEKKVENFFFFNSFLPEFRYLIFYTNNLAGFLRKVQQSFGPDR